MRAYEFIVESFPEARTAFTAELKDQRPDEINQIEPTILQYRQLLNKNQLLGQEKDINHWRGEGWDKFKAFVDEKILEPTKSDIKKSRAVGNSITLRDDTWLIVIPLDLESSCHYGRNTDWCTAKVNQTYFYDYFLKGITLIYCIQKTTGKKWAIALSEKVAQCEFFNQKDDSLNQQQFEEQTRLSITELKSAALSNQNKIKVGRDTLLDKADNSPITKTVLPDRTEEWKNILNQYHREDGPARIEPDGHQEWYRHGLKHRVGRPAITEPDGLEEWWQDGKLHRVDGPAVVDLYNGIQIWYQNGKYHRDDGPAIMYSSGTKEWFQNGLKHRTDGPAIIWPDGSEEYWENGKKIK